MSREDYDIIDLTDRIKKAKEKVKIIDYFGKTPMVSNMDEILSILKSEKGLGTMIFVIHFIANKEMSIEDCIDYVLQGIE